MMHHCCLILALASFFNVFHPMPASGKIPGNKLPSREGIRIDTTLHRYDADHAGIQLIGRADWSNPKQPSFSAPGVYIQASFIGVSCSILLEDQFLYGRSNYFEVILDEQVLQKLVPQPGKSMYPIASGLRYGKHHLRIVKRTEASIGKCVFSGFEIAGTLREAHVDLPRKIQFYGNSISVGSGNEAKNGSPPCADWNLSIPFSNASQSFAALAARKLKAEYHLTGVSGIGLLRNYSSGDLRSMPAVYDLVHPADTASKKWDMTSFVPDAVVIELGTNDFSPGDLPPSQPRPKMDTREFTAAYIQFVNTILGHYPKAQVFCMSSPMLADGWPDSSYHSASDLKKCIVDIASHFTSGGSKQVHKILVNRVAGEGCTTHPSVAQHARIAEETRLAIQAVTGWK